MSSVYCLRIQDNSIAIVCLASTYRCGFKFRLGNKEKKNYIHTKKHTIWPRHAAFTALTSLLSVVSALMILTRSNPSNITININQGETSTSPGASRPGLACFG